MSKLLFQDDIIEGLDVYVEYTIDSPLRIEDKEIILYDYGIELDAEVVINGANGRDVVEYRQHVSLRGYKNTRWLEEKLIEAIEFEERA